MKKSVQRTSTKVLNSRKKTALAVHPAKVDAPRAARLEGKLARKKKLPLGARVVVSKKAA
jgi:hypothetical protein